MKLLAIIKSFFFGSLIRGFVTSYLAFMVIGASLLKLPMSIQSGVSLSWIDALFVSASGLSTTGLSPIVVRDVFTIFGQTVLIFIIQFGGIGLIMMISLFWLAIRQKIGFKQRNMIMTDQNQLSRQGIVRFVRNVLIVIFTIEIIAFIMMFLYLTIKQYFPWQEALFQSLFTTVSLFVNAGFDIAPGRDSFQMYAQDYFMQTLAMTLMVLGAIGFWPLAEFKEWLSAKRKKESFEFSMFTKIVVTLHIGLWLLSALIVFGIESTRYFSDKGLLESIYYALFMSLTTRNAGFSTMSMNDLSVPVQVLFVGLMFVGSSPNSAGGGIRTTTLLVIILTIRSFAKGYEKITFRQRTLKDETIRKSFIAMIVAILLISVNLFVMTITEPFSVTEIAFEIVSAFGTTGLSLGITSQLTIIGKAVLIMTMFIGRIGILALLLMFKPRLKKKGYVQYPDMDLIVG